MNRQLEENVEKAWNSLSPDLQLRIQSEMGFTRENVSAEELIHLVLSYVSPRLMEIKTERRIREEVSKIRDRFETQVQQGLNHIQQQVYNQLMIMAQAMEKMASSHQLTAAQERKQIESAEAKARSCLQPPALSYTNCIRQHPPSKEEPAGRPGPERCVLNIPQEDGIHMRCLIAYVSQNPGDKGFARLPYQIFHAELLRQGNCPRPLSRSVTRRIPGISWLFTKPDICPLASGEEVVIEYGGKTK